MPLDLHTNSDASLYEIMQAFVTALAVINLEVCGLIFFDADAKADMGAKMTDSRQGRRVYRRTFRPIWHKAGERLEGLRTAAGIPWVDNAPAELRRLLARLCVEAEAEGEADLRSLFSPDEVGFCLRCLHHLSSVTLSSKIGEGRWS